MTQWLIVRSKYKIKFGKLNKPTLIIMSNYVIKQEHNFVSTNKKSLELPEKLLLIQLICDKSVQHHSLWYFKIILYYIPQNVDFGENV